MATPAPRTFSPREVADAVGVSESSVKRWIDAGALPAARTVGGHRRIGFEEAVAFIRRRGLAVARPDVLGLAEVVDTEPELAAAPITEGLLAELFEAGRGDQARRLVVAAYLRGDALPALCDGPVAAFMEHVGRLWEEQRSGIATEHRAVDLFAQAFHQIRAAIPAPVLGAPVAVGAGASGEPYVLPSLMAATVLADLGFAVTNLGPDTPPDVLAETAEGAGAALVWYSVSQPPRAADVTTLGTLAVLADGLAPTGAEVVAGGRAVNGLTSRWPNLRILPTMAALAEVGREVTLAAEEG